MHLTVRMILMRTITEKDKAGEGKFWKPGYAGTIEMAAGSEEGNVSD